MKSIEEVIRDIFFFFLSKRTNVPLLKQHTTEYSSNISACTNLKYNIDGLNIKNCIELIIRLTPFFYYLIRTYSRKNGLCNLYVCVDVYFPEIETLFSDEYLRIMGLNVCTVKKRYTSYSDQSILEK